jgi:hypothetical protein
MTVKELIETLQKHNYEAKVEGFLIIEKISKEDKKNDLKVGFSKASIPGCCEIT